MLLAIAVGTMLGWFVPRVAWYYVQGYLARDGRDPRKQHVPWCGARAMGLISAAFGGVAALWWRLHPAWAEFLPVMIVVTLLVIIALVDLTVRRIPNQLVLVLFFWAVIQSLWTGHPSLTRLALGTLVGGGIFLLIAIAGRGALGMGDVKLAAALGAVLGYPAVINALFAGVIAGGVSALVLILMRRISRKDYMAYGPYLALGAILVLVQLG